MRVLFFHVVQSLVFLLLPWKDERPPFPPMAASGCQALLSAAARGCLSQACLSRACLSQACPSLPEQSWRGGRGQLERLSKATAPCRHRAGPKGAPQTRLSCCVPGEARALPGLWEPLRGTSSPCALPSSGAGSASPLLLRQSLPGPGVPQLLGRFVCFHQYL